MGFEEAADEIQDLYLDGRPRDAAAAVPFEFIDATALIGPPERIAERIGRYADAGVTTLSVAPATRRRRPSGACRCCARWRTLLGRPTGLTSDRPSA